MYQQARCSASVEVLRASSADCAAWTLDDLAQASRFVSEWTPMPSMSRARCALGAVCDHDRSSLFAAGGYGGDHLYLSSCEVLDLGASSDARWRPIPDMSCARAGCNALVGPDGRLFVLGGGPDGRHAWKSIEALDPRTKQWDTTLAPMPTARHYNAAAFSPDGQLYVSGTFRHSGQLDVIDRYDPRANAWERLRPLGRVIDFSAGCFVF